MKRAALRMLVLVVTCVGCLAICRADETAAITGLVTDPAGRSVPGVKVAITNLGTNMEATTTTNEQGIYRIVALQPGIYRITVVKEGFKSVVKGGLELHVQDVASINFELEIGSVNETVTVEGGAPVIETQSAAISTVIDRNFVENLPLNGRSFNTLLELTPGVVIAPSTRSSPGQFSVNGQRTDANHVSIDGVSATFGVNASEGLSQSGSGAIPAFNAQGGTSGLVSVDAVQEFRVQTSSFAPEYGRTPGAQISITTRSGTNDFHGAVFEYFRNDKLDANDWFNDATIDPTTGKSLANGKERQNDFGGVLGGPIIRDKTFFFFSYEGLRLRQPQTTQIMVPSLPARSAANAAASPYLNAFPTPNGAVDAQDPEVAQFTGNVSNSATLNATSLRVDHSLNSKITLFARYNYAPSDTGIRTNALSEILSQRVDTQTFTFGMTAVLNPQLTNSFRGNYSVQTAGSSFRPDSFGGATPLSVANLLPAPLSAATSEAAFSFPDTSTLDLGTPASNRESQINFLDDLAFTVRSHQLKFGVDYRELRLKQDGTALLADYFPTSISDFSTSDQAFTVGISQRPGKLLLRAASLYAQDAFRVTPRLTMTYGLRWDFSPVPSGEDGTTLASWENVGQPNSLALAPAGTPPWKSTHNNFAPRIGIAYQLTSKGDFVVRGGAGLFYDLGTGIAPNLLSTFPNSANTFAFATLPLTSASAITPSFSTTTFSGQVQGYDPNLQLPRSWQWNVALEKSFWGQQSLSLTYVGQLGQRLLRQEELVTPNVNFQSNFDLTTNGDSSNYQAMQVQYRRAMSHGLEALLNYTWSHSLDSGSSDSAFVNSSAVISNASDHGNSDFDVRHNFSGGLAYEIPGVGKSSVLKGLTEGWSVYPVVAARTGFPITILTRQAIPLGGLAFPTRPDIVPNVPFWISDPLAPGGQVLNPAAFVDPATPRQGTLSRNAIPGFGFAEADVSFGRQFALGERVHLQFRSDFFNISNHPNFANPGPFLFNGVLLFNKSTQMLNSSLSANGQGFSPLYQTGGPRSIQLSMKLTF